MDEVGKTHSELRKPLTQWLDFLKPILDEVGSYEWEGKDIEQLWEILRRGVVVRQFEALQTIGQMVEQGHGHFAVVLLRPA